MRSSDKIILVAQFDLPGSENVVSLLQFFDRHEGIPEKIKVVINRLGFEETQISLIKAVETIGREISGSSPTITRRWSSRETTGSPSSRKRQNRS